MIKFNLEPNTQTIDTINFNYEGIYINEIPVKFLQIRDYMDEYNIGKNLEKFRKFNESQIDALKYEYIAEIIKNAETSLNGFKPTHIITLKSHHREITYLISLLNNNILSKNDIYPVDISGCFVKNFEKSITEYESALDDFLVEYRLKKRLLKNMYIERLLIVDDVIKKGRVVNQLLIRLSRNKNIDSNTKVFIYTIYSFKILQ